MPTEFTSGTPTDPTSTKQTKFIGSVENTITKENSYYEQLLQKRQQYEDSLASKSEPVPIIDPIEALSPIEAEKLTQWERSQALKNAFSDTIDKNKDAWFSGNDFADQLANKALGFGANVVTEIGLGVYKLPMELGVVVDRANIADVDYTKAKTINYKLKEGVELNSEELAWAKDSNSNFQQASRLIRGEEKIQDVDKLTQTIKSVIDTSSEDFALANLKQTNAKALRQFKADEGLKGFATYLGGVGELITEHPDATLQFISESLPYMIAMAKAPVKGIVVSAAGINEQAVQEFQKEYNRIPTSTEQIIAASVSTVSAGLDALGAQVSLAGKGALRSLVNISKNAGIQIPKVILNKAASALLKTSTSKATAATAKVLLRAAETTAVEGGTEAAQNILEQYAGKQDISKIDPSTAMIEGQIGAASGLGLGSIGEISIAQKKRITKRLNEHKEIVATTVNKFKQTEVFKQYEDNELSIIDTNKEFNEITGNTNSTANEIKTATHNLIGSFIKEPAAQTAFNAKVILAKIEQLEIDPEVATETIQLIKDISELDPTKNTFVSKVKELKAVKAIFESPKSQVERGKKEDNPELMLKGFKDLEWSKLDPKERVIQLEAMGEALTNFSSEISGIENKYDKELQQAELDKYTATYGQLSKISEQQDTAALHKDIKTFIGEEVSEVTEIDKVGVTRILNSMGPTTTFNISTQQTEVLINSGKLDPEQTKIAKTYLAQKKTYDAVTKQVNNSIKDYRTKLNTHIKNNDVTKANALMNKYASWFKTQKKKEATGFITKKGLPVKIETEFLKQQVKLTSETMTAALKVLDNKYQTGFGEKYDFKATTPVKAESIKEVVKPVKKNRTEYFKERAKGTKQETKKLTKKSIPTKVEAKVSKPSTPVKPKRTSLEARQYQELLPFLEELKVINPASDLLKGLGLESVKTTFKVDPKDESKVQKLTTKIQSIKDRQLIEQRSQEYQKALETLSTSEVLSEQNQQRAVKAITELGSILAAEDRLSDKVLTDSKAFLAVMELLRERYELNKSKQLRERILLNPITIRSDKESTYKNIPKKLGNIVRTKTGKTTNLFQKAPTLFQDFKVNLLKHTGKDYTKLSANHKNTLDLVIKFQDDFTNLINVKNSILRDINPKNVKGSKKNIPYLSDLDNDVMSYFIQERTTGIDKIGNPIIERYVDQTLIGILSTTSLEWLGTRSTDTLINTPEAIQKILGLPTTTQPTADQVNTLRNIGTPRGTIEETLGNSIYKMLELSKKDSVYPHVTPRLKLALGQLAITSLLESGYLTESKQTLDELLSKDEAAKTSFEFLDTKFLQIKTKQLPNQQEVVADNVSTIIKNLEASKNLLQDIFNVESSVKDFSLQPYKDLASRTIKNSRQKVTTFANKVMNLESKKPWTVNTVVTELDNFIDFDTKLKIHGFKDPTGKHKFEAAAINDANAVLEKQLNQIEQVQKDASLKQSIYFQYEQWSTGRIGLVSTLLNPLASKIHRFSMAKDSWSHTIEPTDANGIEAFKFAIAQSLGISIEQDPVTILNDLDNKLKEQVLIDAVYAIQQLISKDNLFSEQITKYQEDIVAGVKFGEEDSHTYRGLVELANAAKQVRSNTKQISLTNKTFTSSMPVEIDGKTNGIAFSLMQAGGDNSGIVTERTHDLLNACGVLTKGATSYINWSKKLLNFDVYEIIANKLNSELKINPEHKVLLEPVIGILEEDGQITPTGRNFTKTPVLMFNFGAGAKAIKQSLFDGTVSNIYALIVDSKTNELKYQQASELLIWLFGSDLGLKHLDVVNFEFNETQLTAIQNVLNSTYGDAITKSLYDVFGGITKYKTALNQAAGLMFHAFKLKYDVKVTNAKKEIKSKTGIDRDLTIDEKYIILDELESVLPAFKGPNSSTIKDSILALDETKTKDYTNDQNQEQYSRIINNTDSSSTTSTVSNIDFESAGIKALILNIHNMDVVVQQRVMEKFDVLNIHDATLGSFTDLTDRGQIHNEAFVELNKEYHGLASMFERLQEIIKVTDTLSLDVLVNKDEKLFKGSIDTQAAISNIRAALIDSTSARDEIFEIDPTIDQYISPGSAYTTDTKWIKNTKETWEKNQVPKEIDDSSELLFTNTLGSIDVNLDVSNFQSDYDQDINSITLQQVFDDLDSFGKTPENVIHKARLQDVLDTIISKILTPLSNLKLHIEEKGEVTQGVIKDKDIYIYSNVINSPTNVQMSVQETTVHELLHAITQQSLDSNPGIRRQVLRIYKAAKKFITPEDFLQYTTDTEGNKDIIYTISEQAEKEAAQQQYDHIFNNKEGNGLYEFVAFGLSNEAVINRLSQEKFTSTVDKTQPFLDVMLEMWHNILDNLTDQIHKISGQTLDVALSNLVQQLNTVKDNKIGFIRSKLQFLSVIDDKVYPTLQKYIFGPYKLDKFMSVDKFNLTMKRIRRNIGLTENNFIIKLIREIVIGQTKDNGKWHTLLRRAKNIIDRLKNHASDITSKYIVDSFHNTMTEEESKALYRVMIKTNISSIFDKYGDFTEDAQYDRTQITEMLRDSSVLTREINKLQQDIKADTISSTYYTNQANLLGFHMATGLAARQEINLNAYQIFHKAGVIDQVADVVTDSDKVTKQIDTLATLFALSYTTKHNKTLVANKIDTEFKSNNELNGIIAILDNNKLSNNNAKNDLFSGKDGLMIKNYSSDITNPNTDIVPGRLEDEVELKKDGYFRISDIPLFKDTEDPNNVPMYLYVTKEASLSERVRTIVSVTSRQSKGTTLKDIYMNGGDLSPNRSAKFEAGAILKNNQTAVKKQFTSLLGDLSHSNRNYMVPIRNEVSGTSDYRYMMTDHVKQTILEQDERIEKVMGATDSSIVDKKNSKEINREVVELAYQDYLDNYSKEPNTYKSVSHNSPDGEKYNEIYQLLPEDMRQDMEEIWGDKEMLIKEEMIDLIFGFRKASLLNLKIFNKEIGRAINTTLTKVNDIISKQFPKIKYQGTLPLKALEAKLQDAIGIAKDMIVVKSGAVLVGNTISNSLLLLVKGVPINKIASLQIEAYRVIEDYHELVTKRDIISKQLESTNLSKTKKENLKIKLANLNTEIKVNPATTLVDEGIFQSIIEDIEIDKNIYNTSSKIANFTEKWADEHLPHWISSTAKAGWMSKDTPHYKLLFKMTQYGDFVSRYALFQHRMEQQKLTNVNFGYTSLENKKKYNDIIQEVVETFINYDVPTSPEMQWANDVGMFMFTKFMFRIQRIIFKNMAERPATSLAVMSMRSMLGLDLSYISDSLLSMGGMLSRFNNPFNVMWENLVQIPLFQIDSGL